MPQAPYGGSPTDAYGQPQYAPVAPYGYGVDDPRKSKLAAGLLAILIGGFGIHNFYLGYTGKAIAQLVLTLTCIGYLPSVIWSIVEGIMILTGSIATDAKGIPLKD